MIGKTLLGADEYLTKPFEIEDLLEAVATFVKDR
jgi:DNA-binding response OmpR family regulator